MKRFFLSIVALIFATMSFAQIEEWDEASIVKDKPKQQPFIKTDYFVSYNNQLSPIQELSNGDLLIYNLIGKKLCSVAETKNFKYRPQSETETQQIFEGYRYVVAKKENTIYLKHFQPRKYYNVKNILITQEEIDSLQSIINISDFDGDTIFYLEIKDFATGTVLDKASEIPKKAKKYIIQREDICPYLLGISSEMWESEKWPIQEDLTTAKNDKKINNAIYVLADEEGYEYYVPIVIPNHMRRRVGGNQNMHIFLKKHFLQIPFGKMCIITDFVSVKGFEKIKSTYENHGIVRQEYNYCQNTSETLLCKKVVLKDGNIVAVVTDSLSSDVRFMPITDIYQRAYTWCNPNDTLTFLKLKTQFEIRPKVIITSEKAIDYCRTHDLDSIEAKIAYEKQIKEQEELRKDEKKKNELIKQYGKEYAQCIIDGKACIGMTQQMCIEAMGRPDSKQKSMSALGTIEVWTYSRAAEIFNHLVPVVQVTFLDGKVTSIDEY